MDGNMLLELRKFVAPEFVFGIRAHELAGQYAVNLGAEKVLLVSDHGVKKAGWTDRVRLSLEEKGIQAVQFLEVSPNPRDVEVMTGARIYENEGCEAIVTVGGGSPMDCAKGIGIVITNQKHVLTFEGVDMVEIPGPPLVCIPTTAGTSADVSQFAIITDTERKVKIAIVSKTVVPDAALIDPLLTTTMDAHLTACTGVDALTHAIEAYVSNANAAVTDLLALEAVRYISTHLLGAIAEPLNMDRRGKMMMGSLMAGLAFSNAILGAVHAMAHSLGGFLDLPHGECNAILLDHVIDANFEAAPDRYRAIGKALGLHPPLADQKQAIIGAIRSLKKAAGLVRTLGDLGMSKKDIPILAEKAIADACMVTNPCQLSPKDIERIYEKAF
jgi:alcohol dehydrogenase class IV